MECSPAGLAEPSRLTLERAEEVRTGPSNHESYLSRELSLEN